MKKIPTLYLRDPATKLRYVMPELHPDCQWVIDGEGTATYKWDGTSVLIDPDVNHLWKRREVKPGKDEPPLFVELYHDPVTGKRVGWVPCNRDKPEDRWHWEAYDVDGDSLPVGTYELVGPKVQGNPHGFSEHKLIRHGEHAMTSVPTGFVKLGQWLNLAKEISWFSDGTGTALGGFEGIVWHHPDGRMAKIKAKDFPS